jgi:hypothetical protein
MEEEIVIIRFTDDYEPKTYTIKSEKCYGFSPLGRLQERVRIKKLKEENETYS